MVEAPRFVIVDDYEPYAREMLPADVYGYFAGGAGDERSLGENVNAFDRWVLRPRFLRGVDACDPSTSVLGAELAFPVVIAPWAYQWMAHADGELATARAAAAAGTVMTVSSTVLERLEDVSAASGAVKWWQLYIFTDRGRTADLLRQAGAAGYRAIVWTVDVPVLGLRHRDTRTGFDLPVGTPGAELLFDRSLTWDDLVWIRSLVPDVPVVVKGIVTAEDARLAVEHGADGIVVSNHGGRQLDRSVAGIDALPEVVEAVEGRTPVLMDGGIRRGVDGLTALALGAKAVMVGRPTGWGLTVAGEAGVIDVLRILRDEFENAMTLAGCRSVADISRELVERRS
jgi:isopentenyl diphosphate isomerase/L-lactate dehydrogenase-like FMN-dependent dehydrogenase